MPPARTSTKPSSWSYSDGGRTHFLSLPKSEVAAVRVAAERYRRAKAKLEAQANAGLAQLVDHLARRKQL